MNYAKYSEVSSTIEMESRIIEIIRKDNTRDNTIHFVWDRAPFSPTDYVLKVVTRNVYNGETFLLKMVHAPAPSECFKLMIEYVEEEQKNETSWTVFWIDENAMPHMSYFRATNEDEVRDKFNFSTATKSTIKNIIKNPIS